MSKVFECSTDNISLHLKHIFQDNELNKDSVTEKCSLTADDGKKYNTTIYSLDSIIAVGYRVNSKKATEFRIWATKILKEYMIKVFALSDERFIKGNKYDTKYFDELLERIKTIRVSERMAYQKITDLFIATSIDYNPKSEDAYNFFKIVQNKLHYAVSGHTAAELIKEGKSKEERFEKLQKIVKYQLKILDNEEKYNIQELEEKLKRCRNMKLEDVTLNDVDELSSIKIDRRKSSNERILDFLTKVKNSYIFKINGRLVRIRFSENIPTTEDCLTNVLKNLYR